MIASLDSKDFVVKNFDEDTELAIDLQLLKADKERDKKSQLPENKF